MNLNEFFECMAPETIVVIEWNGEEIFSSKIGDISENEAVLYWIKAESIVFKDGVMHIPVEHQDEVNRKLLERNNSIVCSKKNIRNRIEILEALKWAQEHQNQIYHLLCNAIDPSDAKRQFKMLYNFNEEQACAIIDMRVKKLCKKERNKLEEELQEYLEQECMFLNLD